MPLPVTGLQSSWFGTLYLLGLKTLLGYDLLLPALSLRFLSLQEGLPELSLPTVSCVCARVRQLHTPGPLRACSVSAHHQSPLTSVLATPRREETMSQGGDRKYQCGKLPAPFQGHRAPPGDIGQRHSKAKCSAKGSCQWETGWPPVPLALVSARQARLCQRPLVRRSMTGSRPGVRLTPL